MLGTVLHCAAMYHIAQLCNFLHSIELHCIELHCIELHCTKRALAKAMPKILQSLLIT